MTDAQIQIAGEMLTLLPERAIYWERMKTLLIADAHFGKSATFRANRIPIPKGSLQADLARLTQALTRTGVERLIVLGDLLHTAQGCDDDTITAVRRWREQYSDLQITLVRGNHDLHAGDPPEEWQIQSVDAPLVLAPFVLSHHPNDSVDGYGLAGHLHPLTLLEGKSKQSLKLPCFWFGAKVAVLPAFGSFIDGSIIRSTRGDHLFVVAGQQVFYIGKPIQNEG